MCGDLLCLVQRQQIKASETHLPVEYIKLDQLLPLPSIARSHSSDKKLTSISSKNSLANRRDKQTAAECCCTIRTIEDDCTLHSCDKRIQNQKPNFLNPKDDDIPRSTITKTSEESTFSRGCKTAVQPEIKGLKTISTKFLSSKNLIIASILYLQTAQTVLVRSAEFPGHCFCKSGNNWIRFIKWLRRVHEMCAGVESVWKTYLCEHCTR